MPPVRASRRAGWVTVFAVALAAVEAVWVLAGLAYAWPHPWIGWLPPVMSAALTAYACRRVSRRTDLAVTTRRFWGCLGASSAVLVLAQLSNAHDALGGPTPSQNVGPLTLALLVTVVLIMMWGLLRLPTWQRTSGDWARFALDAGVLMITSAGLLWHWSLRFDYAWNGQGQATLVVCVLALVSLLATVKVTLAGVGQLDRPALLILSGGVALSASCGALAPLLATRPYLSTGFLCGPIASLTSAIAAERQHRAPARPPARRAPGGRFSALPYLAVAAMTATMLIDQARGGGEQLVIGCCVAAITALVVTRQVTVLRDNARLLDTVDASLRRLREYQTRLDHQVSHDTLTGIANRTAFTDHVTAVLDTGIGCHVALLDLDDFKTVNDRLGHGTGDALLRAVSLRLHERLRTVDLVARLGGDEFTLLLPGLDDARAGEVLREVAEAVQQPLVLDGRDLVPRVSIGITEALPGDTPQELLRRADVAMYAAKNSGGGRCTWFDPMMDRLADADARLADDLRQAIARDELFVAYQPIVELPHGRLAGVEALLRWRHPARGLVSPSVFVPLAERDGSIVELGRWVLEQVVAQAARWEETYGAGAPAKVSVNISARQLHEPGFPAEVAELLRSSGVDPHRLVAEVTETAVLGTGEALEAVRALHALGIRVALDDFGTGQSSLSLLVDCPVNILKVDKSFVDGVGVPQPDAGAAPKQAVIVDGLIGITEGLRIEAVAEGVETADQAFKLHKMGYRYAQGFHFARPMTSEDIDLLLDLPVRGKVDNFH